MARVHGQGRVLVRYSGTEPLLRVMLEGKDEDEIKAWAQEIADVVQPLVTGERHASQDLSPDARRRSVVNGCFSAN